MASRTAEHQRPVDKKDINSPWARQELARQKTVLARAFEDPFYTGDPHRKAILETVHTRIDDIKNGKGSLQDFLDFQKNAVLNPDYAFLELDHPGLNASGWGVLMAQLDPLMHGTGIHRIIDQY